jgi:hypothetical protein
MLQWVDPMGEELYRRKRKSRPNDSTVCVYSCKIETRHQRPDHWLRYPQYPRSSNRRTDLNGPPPPKRAFLNALPEPT